ncbi:MAG: ferritin-like domain-containing protein [Polyangia bacterium]
MTLEPFELSILGGASEARYRAQRPEVERMPWGTIDRGRYSGASLAAGRRIWTLAAFQEHRTGAACARTLAALIAARAPLDLIAVATRFPLDEMVHVELCARLAGELGGPVRVMHDAGKLVREPKAGLSPKLACAELVVRNFCVGEAVSIPILRASWKAADEPLIAAVLQRIVKDESAHGQFGWLFLDWILDDLGSEERAHLAKAARHEIGCIERNWSDVVGKQKSLGAGAALGWMDPEVYLPTARLAMKEAVEKPLAERGLLLSA